MRLLKALFAVAFILLAACAHRGAPEEGMAGYVEIDNPALTMNPNAPAKIWVPRSYVEKGIPRGGDLVKMGTEKVMQAFGRNPQPQPTFPAQQPAPSVQQPSAPAAQPTVAAPPPSAFQLNQPAAVAQPFPASRQTVASAPPQPYVDRAPAQALPPSMVKTRIAILELSKNDLTIPLYENLRRAGIGTLIDPVQTAYLAQYSTVASDAEKAAFATRLQQDYGANVLIYVSAPDGVGPGKPVVAEVYDTMAGGLLRKFDAPLSLSDAADQAERSAAIASALGTFTDKLKELISYLPWYGRITAVEGNRAYIAAGKEAGICVGQVLKVFRGGKFIKGLGYAPGDLIGTMVVQGFVGPNGSFGQVRGEEMVKPADIVSSE